MTHEMCGAGAKESRWNHSKWKFQEKFKNGGHSSSTLQNMHKLQKSANMSKIHTTETEATRSYIIIPASARARLAHDMTTGRSPATSSIILLQLETWQKNN